MLSGIDYFVVVAYLIGIMLLGLYFRKFIHSSQDYFLAGRSLPFWAIGMSIVVSDIGAMDFVGVSGQAYRYGIAVGNVADLNIIDAPNVQEALRTRASRPYILKNGRVIASFTKSAALL